MRTKMRKLISLASDVIDHQLDCIRARSMYRTLTFIWYRYTALKVCLTTN